MKNKPWIPRAGALGSLRTCTLDGLPMFALAGILNTTDAYDEWIDKGYWDIIWQGEYLCCFWSSFCIPVFFPD
jgi:hypothetical protein